MVLVYKFLQRYAFSFEIVSGVGGFNCFLQWGRLWDWREGRAELAQTGDGTGGKGGRLWRWGRGEWVFLGFWLGGFG